MSQWSDERHVQDRCPRFPIDTNKNAQCRAQLAAITLLPSEASIIYIANFATLYQPPFKNSCKGQIKMNLNTALQQNCDQSVSLVVKMEYCKKILESENGALLGT